MDRFKKLNKSHQNSLELWLKVLGVFRMNIFVHSLSFFKICLFIVIYMFITLDILKMIDSTQNRLLPFFVFNTLNTTSQAILKCFIFNMHGKKIVDLIVTIDEMMLSKEERRQSTLPLDKYYSTHFINFVFKGVFLAVMVEVLIKTSSALVWPLVNVYLKGDIEWEILIELFTAVIYLSVNIVSITYRCLQGAIAVNASFVYLLVQADIENMMKMEFNEEKFEETIINLIQYHQKINRLTCELRDIFTISYCGDLLAASQKLGCQGFTLMTINSIDIQGYFVQIWYIIKTVLSFFILYWPGQLLADMSARVATAAFSIRWYTKNRRISTLVNLIILRSQRPAHMTSKFELMTLRSFGKILVKGWSYACLLTNIGRCILVHTIHLQGK